MAVQIPDPGQGDNKTGDNEYVFRKKVQNNFSDPNNAASRLVGTGYKNVMEVGAFGLGSDGARLEYTSRDELRLAKVGAGIYRCKTMSDDPTGGDYVDYYLVINRSSGGIYYGLQAQTVNGSSVQPDLYICHYSPSGWTDWAKVYNDKNTTLDSNGALKPSSPVLRVFSDKLEGNSDGDAMGAVYTKNGVGDYTISGTTGLRSDGWYITIPNDMNGNPKVAVTLDDTDGVITLRSYVRIFDMTTFKFVPDLNQPLDIPDGRWIDLRFNDLPAEPMPPEV